MDQDLITPGFYSRKNIKDLILARALFAIFLCLGCFIYGISEGLSFYSQPFISLYNLSAIILVISIIYIVIYYQITDFKWFIHVQLVLDTCFITAVIFITGGINSIFSFLYLLVIIYSSMLVLLKGSLMIATLTCIQYISITLLEFHGVLRPIIGEHTIYHTTNTNQIIYKIIIISGASYAISLLSGLLAQQAKNARQELKITQQHLSRVEKMNAMDEMLSGIAHEIKNPLASLSGSIQLLKEDTQPGSSEEKLMKIILRETERLKEILNDIRLFSRPSREGSVNLQLSRLLRETVELFANDPEWSDRVDLFLKIQKEVVVFMDPVHFKQILWNLLKNAAQSIEGTGRIFIELSVSKQSRVYLTIRDTGQGINEQDALHIFDPFFTTKTDGSGLGLSIIHKIVDAYDGMIDFESTPGKGTVFTLILNITDPDSD
ncbi:MAG: GHKL domain-containing protein [Desulfobacteraceae bacterium]|nr:MAG: GHKL domain-containing protein [Desulfobacteraceae bacterium]